MNIKEAVKVELALRLLKKHKRLLVESAGEDLGYPNLDQAIQALEDL